MRAAAPDVFAELGPLEPGLAGPCFRGAAGARRCLPAFSIIGVSKCGTTDMYRKLLALPSVHPAANKAGSPRAAQAADDRGPRHSPTGACFACRIIH